jgi:hypothetical protein
LAGILKALAGPSGPAPFSSGERSVIVADLRGLEGGAAGQCCRCHQHHDDINRIDQAFGRSYPPSYPASTSSQQLIGDAQTRWQNSLAAYQDALRVQATVVQSLETSRAQTNGLVSSSQSAVGILQASQAGNQLIALQTRAPSSCSTKPSVFLT